MSSPKIIDIIEKLKKRNDNTHCYLNWAVTTALEAGKRITHAFHEPKNVSSKSSSVDLVTKTDQEVEQFILSELKKNFPSHRFIGEESVAAGEQCQLSDEPTWIVDPIDGTINFIHRFPYVAVSIAFAVEKKIQIGVIYNPILDDLYLAVRGEGSFWNGTKIRVSGEKDIRSSLLLSEWGSDRHPKSMETKAENKKKAVGVEPNAARGLRSLGSCALNMCLVASGSADAYFEWGIHCWDLAAGVVIVEEAGGVVLDGQGKGLDMMARNVLCASTENLALQLATRLTPIDLPKD